MEKITDVVASVVMPTFNKKERLSLALESFRYQTITTDNYELIIVDDGSVDGTIKTVEEFQSDLPIRYIQQDNKGRSAARNKGIQKARGKILIFSDDDLIAAPTFLEAHINAHKQEECVAHGAIYNLPYVKFFKNPATGETYEEIDSEILLQVKKYCIGKKEVGDIGTIHKQSKTTLLEKNIKKIFMKNLYAYQWLCCTGANVSFEKTLLKDGGMFDESFGREWGAEDFELGYRLYKRGVKFVYLEQGHNYHLMHARMDFKTAMTNSIDKFYSHHPEKEILHLGKLLSGEIRDIEEYIEFINNLS